MLSVGLLASVFVIIVLELLLGPPGCHVVVLRDKKVLHQLDVVVAAKPILKLPVLGLR